MHQICSDSACQEQAQSEKKPYVRPQLANHGTVESQTQTAIYGGPSGPQTA